MKSLKEIVYSINVNQWVGATDLKIDALFLNSREVKKDGLFIAVKGYTVDGHQYIENAISQGAIAIVCEVLPIRLNEKITYIVV